MIASAERATSRDALVDLLLGAHGHALGAPCGCATSESRRSATHFAPVAFFTEAPTKWIEFGGEVVTTTSMPSLRAMRIAAGIAVRFQLTFSSGTSNRREASLACTSARSRPSAAVQLLGRLPPFGPT